MDYVAKLPSEDPVPDAQRNTYMLTPAEVELHAKSSENKNIHRTETVVGIVLSSASVCKHSNRYPDAITST